MEQTELDPVEAAGQRREKAWKHLDQVHRQLPDCEHLQGALAGIPECEHVAAWRREISAAGREYGDALTECDRVAREFFINAPSAGTPIG